MGAEEQKAGMSVVIFMKGVCDDGRAEGWAPAGNYSTAAKSSERMRRTLDSSGDAGVEGCPHRRAGRLFGKPSSSTRGTSGPSVQTLLKTPPLLTSSQVISSQQRVWILNVSPHDGASGGSVQLFSSWLSTLTPLYRWSSACSTVQYKMFLSSWEVT